MTGFRVLEKPCPKPSFFAPSILNLLRIRADTQPLALKESAVAAMDLGSKDFSLNFHGFEQNDPETVQRFTAFCEANFALSPETVSLLKSSPETIVLTHGGSLEELEALAKVLREIGAVVDVSEDGHDLSSVVGGPSTQELHRLFGAQSQSSNDDTALSCPYPPPLERSLYIFSRADTVLDRRALRKRSAREASSVEDASVPTPIKQSALLIITCAALCVGLAAAVTASILIKNHGLPSERGVAKAVQQESSRRDIAATNAAPPRNLTASKAITGNNVELRILASAKAVSVSALSIQPTNIVGADSGATIRRIEAEPTFLSETAPSEWQGAIILSVSFEEAGKSSHFTIPASITVKVNGDYSSGRASIKVGAAQNSDGGITLSRSESGVYEVRGIPLLELPLS